MKSRMNVYLTTAKRAVIYAYPTILSLFEHNQDSEIYLYIVSEDLEETDIGKESELARQYGNHIIILHFDEDMAREKVVCGNAEHWPLGTLGCYWLFHELLPADVDRIMALESDTVVVGDLSEFYHSDMGGNYAACPDPAHKPETHRRLMREMGGDVLTFVVSLYDVKAIQRDFTLDNILEADRKVVEWFGHSQQELTFGILFRSRILFVPAERLCVEENRQSMKNLGYDYLIECENTCKVLHFSSYRDKGKPWNPVCIMPGYLAWWEYAGKSPYYKEYFLEQWKSYDRREESVQELKKYETWRNVLFLTLLLYVCLLLLAAVILHWDPAMPAVIITAPFIALGLAMLARRISIWNMKRKMPKGQMREGKL